MLFGVIKNHPGLHSKEPLQGLFELADGGTLFLDEIGALPLAVQPKLLRAIQEGEIRPLGAPHTVRADVRVIAATNRDLEQAMQAGQFRADLYHRLNVVTLEAVPLRQRKDDIPALIEHFLSRACEKQKRPKFQLSDEALEVLLAYDYPGNVRELENLIERAVILTAGDTIFPEVLPVRPRGVGGALDLMPNLSDLTLAEALNRLEKTYLEQQLRHTRGNISQAASRAGIDRKNFREKLKKYNINVASYITP
jgi:DNA-binding NtrC family response regulator